MQATARRLLARAYGRRIDRPGSMSEKCRISLFQDVVTVEDMDSGETLLSVPVERVISLGRYAQEAGRTEKKKDHRLSGEGFRGGDAGKSGGWNIFGGILGRIIMARSGGSGPKMLQLQYWSVAGSHEGMFFGEPDFGIIESKFNKLRKKRR